MGLCLTRYDQLVDLLEILMLISFDRKTLGKREGGFLKNLDCGREVN